MIAAGVADGRATPEAIVSRKSESFFECDIVELFRRQSRRLAHLISSDAHFVSVARTPAGLSSGARHEELAREQALNRFHHTASMKRCVPGEMSRSHTLTRRAGRTPVIRRSRARISGLF